MLISFCRCVSESDRERFSVLRLLPPVPYWITLLPVFPYRRRVTNASEAKQAVDELKRLGVDFIKVHDHTPREAFFAIAAEAPKVGSTFAGHVPMDVTIDEAAGSGMKSIEHLANFRVFGDCSGGDTYTLKSCMSMFEKLARNGVWETPTMEFSNASRHLLWNSAASLRVRQ